MAARLIKHLDGICQPAECPHCKEESEKEIKEMYQDIGGEG
jgi:hypothetical protein